MPINRHISLLETRVELLQDLLRRKNAPDIGWGCLQNIIAEGDGWSDWQDFLDHGRYAAIERNWYDRTLKALERMGVEDVTLDELRKLESSSQIARERQRMGSREATI
ncbi:MAG: hypothetical protein V4655_09575 [Bdellovibrionota bacterium]|nr:MAG: hypothetical protein EOP10_24885 [Pseudomonadota bacterium]